MRAILVDDERLALRQLKSMLESIEEEIEIMGMYWDPAEVVKMTKKLQPDVIFLDIHMPSINGLMLAEQIQEIIPNIEIVFVTGYDQYAVQAFELYALDYIMKPVQSERLQQTVRRLCEKMGSDKESRYESQAPLICCFNQIGFQHSGEKMEIVKWRTSKAQELFAFLLHHRNHSIDKSTLIELLWPDFELSRAIQQLYTTIYHIRQTLKRYGMGMVTISSGDSDVGYRLTVGEARIDTEEWEALAKEVKAPDRHNISFYEHVLGLFKGNYLGNYEYLWAEHERERLRILWLQLANAMIRFYIEQEELLAAIQVITRIQQLLPDEEESYFTMMKLSDRIGDRIRVEEQFLLLTARMEQELGSTVDSEIIDWYQSWKNHQA